MRALEAAGIASGDVKATLKITEYGERMALSIYLPDAFGFDPGDGHRMALRLECVNSIDGSTRFRALMGWFRFVCSNGLVIGVTRSDVRRRHIGDLRLENVGAVLSSGLKDSEVERKNLERWRRVDVTSDRLAPWVNTDLLRAWGFKAAARAFHIARSGSDALVVGPYGGSTPTTVRTREAHRVPGAPEECRNLFDLSQILAWLAKERRDLHEQMEWREAIPRLLKPLRKRAR